MDSAVQVKTGSRNIVMPGARMHTIVVMKLTEPMIVPKPVAAKPRTHRSPPRLGVNVESDSGAYANQPNDAAPSGTRKPAHAISPPSRYNQ